MQFKGVSGSLGGHVGGIWGHDLPLKSDLAAQRSKSKSQMRSEAVREGGSKNQVSGAGAGGRQSGNGAVSETLVTGAER